MIFGVRLSLFLAKRCGLSLLRMRWNQTRLRTWPPSQHGVGTGHSLVMLVLLRVDSVVSWRGMKNGHAYLPNVSERGQQVDVRGSRSFN